MTKKKVLALILSLMMIVSLCCAFTASAYAEVAPGYASVTLSQSFSATNNHEPLSNDPGLNVTYRLTPAAGQDGSIDRSEMVLNNAQDGTFNFVFMHAGVYTYTVKPDVTDGNFFTYDHTGYTIKIFVKNMPDGSLLPAVTIWNEDGTQKLSEGNSLKYEQVYDLVIVPLELTDADDPLGQKVVLGVPSASAIFNFSFRPVSMNALNLTVQPMPTGTDNNGILTLSIDGAGRFPVGSLTFTEPGTYVYQLSENNDGAAGYTYDTRIYYVTFELKLGDDPATHQYLSGTRTITLNGNVVYTAVFQNTYQNPVTYPTFVDDLPEPGDLPNVGPYEPNVNEPEPKPEPEPIPDQPVPQTERTAWALVNLISAIATVGLSVGTLGSFVKNDKTLEDAESKKKLRSKLISVVPAVGSVLTFVLTEDMRAPMVMVDKWTLLMGGILGADGLTTYFTRVKKDVPAAK